MPPFGLHVACWGSQEPMTDRSGDGSPNTMPQMPEDRPEETEHERIARQQKETQAREGEPEPDVNGPNNKRKEKR